MDKDIVPQYENHYTALFLSRKIEAGYVAEILIELAFFLVEPTKSVI